MYGDGFNERNYNKAELELKALADLVVNGKEADVPKGILKTEFTSEFTKDEFEAVVKKTQHYIKEGDIFQCVVSNRREAEFDGSLLNAYRVLRTLNPASRRLDTTHWKISPSLM